MTGAATGLGEGIAGVLAAAGAEVVIADIDEPGGQRVAAELRDRGHRADALRLDVTDEASASEGIAQAVASAAGSMCWSTTRARSTTPAASSTRPTSRGSGPSPSTTKACSCARSRRPSTWWRGARRGDRQHLVGGRDPALPRYRVRLGEGGPVPVHPQPGRRPRALGVRVNCVAPGNVPVETMRRMRTGELPPLWSEPSVATGLMGPIARSGPRTSRWAARAPGRGRPRRAVPGQRRGVLHHGPDARGGRWMDPRSDRRNDERAERANGRSGRERRR